MSKIHACDSIRDIIFKMSEGNPGAVCATMELLHSDFHSLLMCDSLGLYGVKLYMLWNDCCNRDVSLVRKVMIAWQLKRITTDEIYAHLAGGYGKPFELENPKEGGEE